MRVRGKWLTLILAALMGLYVGLAASQPAVAMEPPRKGELYRYRLDGSLQSRLRRAEQIGNHRMSPALLYNLGKRTHLLGAQGQMAPPLAWQGGIPASGSPKVLVLLIDFPDYPASVSNSVSYVNGQMFGAGTAANAPYESLSGYYKRASYDQLNIQGTVLGWYRAANNRSYYEAKGFGAGNEALIKEALTYFDNAGHDFSQYDNDGNGTIDALYVKWTGPDNGWSNFWWAYMTSWYATSYSVDGKQIGNYVWSWISNPQYDGQSIYTPRVDIHESGHLLGLPDYYDYDANTGPDGGVGGLDMMDANFGDHNAFSKALLGWITPTVVSSGSISKALQPSGTAGEAVLVMPNASGNIFGEFFLSQYRKRGTGNDPLNYPTDGLTIWHVDATLNAGGTDFQYDNSYTSRKLLKLMQADGLNQIENLSANADAGDFYVSPKALTPTSNPNSSKYDGTSSGVTINGLSAAGATLSASYSIGGADTVAFGSSSYSVTEGTATLQIPVVRSNATSAATVDYALASGTATAGSDFTAQSGTLSFGVGVTTLNISVSIADDATAESSETFSVSLKNPSNGTALGSPNTATVTIVDNDSSPTFKFGNAAYSVTEGTTSITIPVTRSTTSGTASVGYATAGGTAVSGSDFTAKSGTLSFASGTATMNITISIANDTVVESDETFTVKLSSPSSGYVLGSPNSSTITIVDNDTQPNIRIGSATYSVTEGTASITIPVTRSSTSGSATVSYATANGTAVSGSDFTAKSGTLSFASGTATMNIKVSITNDTAVESSETFTVKLSSPSSGYVLGTPSSSTVTIVDNDGGSTVAFGAASYTVTEGTASITIPVTRSNSSGTASVSYATAGGTAVSGSDFTAKSGTLSFASGVATMNISVSITNDTAVESSETFTVKLSSPSSGLSLGTPATTSVTIQDNDGTDVTALQNNVAVTGLAGASGSTKYFSLTVPSGASNLRIATSGGSGDVDLYVKLGALPTKSVYDCRPYVAGNAESCVSASPTPGVYYVMLNGFSSYSSVTLVGSFSTTATGAAGSTTIVRLMPTSPPRLQ